MMTDKIKMLCPDCDVEMNQHAEKIDYAAALDDPEAMDDELGGILEEVHSCPACGQTHLRKGASGKEPLKMAEDRE